MTSCCLPLERSLPHEFSYSRSARSRTEGRTCFWLLVALFHKNRTSSEVKVLSFHPSVFTVFFFLLLCFSLLYSTSFFSSFPSCSHVFLYLFIFFLRFLICLVFRLSVPVRSLASKIAWHSYCYWNQETAGRKRNINVSISAPFIDYLCIRITCGICGPPHGRTLFVTSWVEGK